MAKPSISTDVTWDDVRLSRPPSQSARRRLRLLCAGAVLFALTVMVFLLLPSGGDEQALAQQPEARLARPARVRKTREPTLCDHLKSWTGTTVLRLGARTESFCRAAETPGVSRKP